MCLLLFGYSLVFFFFGVGGDILILFSWLEGFIVGLGFCLFFENNLKLGG